MELAPGMLMTSILFFLAALTTLYPGSLKHGVPASEINAILLP